jgi:hypothetical protein
MIYEMCNIFLWRENVSFFFISSLLNICLTVLAARGYLLVADFLQV